MNFYFQEVICTGKNSKKKVSEWVPSSVGNYESLSYTSQQEVCKRSNTENVRAWLSVNLYLTHPKPSHSLLAG